MSERGYKIRNQQTIHFITFAVVEWDFSTALQNIQESLAIIIDGKPS
ncbi:MAG TPA: hypothetical protein VIN73_08005 [Vicingaceae bacterium]